MIINQNQISNEEYKIALNNIDYIKISRKAVKKYVDLLDRDDLESCQMVGLWKALLSFDDDIGTKFTSHLYNVVRNECRKTARKINKSKTNIIIDKIISNDLSIQVYDIIEGLDVDSREIVSDYYLSNMTMKEIGIKLGISIETARRKLKKAIEQLKWKSNSSL